MQTGSEDWAAAKHTSKQSETNIKLSSSNSIMCLYDSGPSSKYKFDTSKYEITLLEEVTCSVGP